MRSQQISRGPERPSETSRDFQDPGPSEPGQIADLRNEIMNLKIDVGIRKELVNQAAGEINRLRQLNESLLVEKGALQFQLLQLAAPVTVTRPIPHEYRSTIESSEGQGKEPHNSGSVDNSTS